MKLEINKEKWWIVSLINENWYYFYLELREMALFLFKPLRLIVLYYVLKDIYSILWMINLEEIRENQSIITVAKLSYLKFILEHHSRDMIRIVVVKDDRGVMKGRRCHDCRDRIWWPADVEGSVCRGNNGPGVRWERHRQRRQGRLVRHRSLVWIILAHSHRRRWFHHRRNIPYSRLLKCRSERGNHPGI